MKKLYFIRHGQSVLNVQKRYGGRTDTPLTSEGRKQAKAAGKAAKGLGIDAIVSSPLSRAHDTAKIIAEEIGFNVADIEINDLLLERNFGSLETQLWEEGLRLEDIADVETADAVLERAHAMHKFIHSLNADTILIVAHGSIGRALRSVIMPDHTYENVTTHGTTKHGGIPNAEIVCWIEN